MRSQPLDFVQLTLSLRDRRAVIRPALLSMSAGLAMAAPMLIGFARTGREIWHYYWKTSGGEYIGNRGMAMYGDWLYFGTPDGRDFLERHPSPGLRPLVIEKQWYSFMLWGRLAYDPSLSDAHFERALDSRDAPTAAPSHHRPRRSASTPRRKQYSVAT